MWCMAISALLGGLDCVSGNHFGIGKRFQDGFKLMGDTALSMTGVLCLAPLFATIISKIVAPACRILKLDPGIFSGVLAIDMGGYSLALELAQNPQIGKFSGVIVAATFGCALTFTIPVGMSMLRKDDQPAFAKGILFGLISMPIALLAGGWMCGLKTLEILWNSLPVLLISLILLLGIWKHMKKTIRCFSGFAEAICILNLVGLIAGAFQYMTGYSLLPGLMPIEEAMEVVAAIAIVMLGSLPLSELIQRALAKPAMRLGRRTGLNGASIAGLLMGMVSVLPAIVMVRDMDRRGKIVNGAFMVCAASAFAAHLGFVAGMDRGMIAPLLAAKLIGGFSGAGVALWATRENSDA